MPEFEGTILLTGANGGLGRAIISSIVSSPELSCFHGIYSLRNASNTIPELDGSLSRKTTPASNGSRLGHTYEKVSLDLSNLTATREFALEINRRVAAGELPPIRAVILNAGYEEFVKQTWTDDGLDTTFVINYLGHWLLVIMLLQSMDRERGRVLWISSFSHNPHDPRSKLVRSHPDAKYQTLITNDLEPIAKGTWSPNALGSNSQAWAPGYRRYGASKFCGVVMIHELQRRIDRDPALKNISILAIDPGSMATGIVRRSGSWFLRVVLFQFLLPALTAFMVYFFPNGNFRTPKKSSHDILAAALKSNPPPLCKRPKGLYLNGSELGFPNPEAADPAKGIIVWKGSVRYAGLTASDTILKDWQ
ncbi:putative short-chain dehydrogenase [Nemania sp. FL0916]|nr:putative short-chain dehydrogenase [Nemania sp. FL0916]